ncbi:hypothetical protein RHGRI_036329 [Rhododendron griersonianum]|uniref:ADP-ribosylation factor n=1 Tax=Rhododendron griersonianum TaxID=479676 RepID=A0AAV6HR32_9ERIC|nr:hypothetical protein RHGRI_036329 [Rhododendron griersonianum]
MKGLPTKLPFELGISSSHDRGALDIYVVDSLDRERIGKAKQEFQAIIRDSFMLNSIILMFANKQDMVCYLSNL